MSRHLNDHCSYVMFLERLVGSLAGIIEWFREEYGEYDDLLKGAIRSAFSGMPDHYFDLEGGTSMSVIRLLKHVDYIDKGNNNFSSSQSGAAVRILDILNNYEAYSKIWDSLGSDVRNEILEMVEKHIESVNK